jgi:hypothetical protein
MNCEGDRINACDPKTVRHRHAVMQHSLHVELLQLWPAPLCKVGCPHCAQLVLTACDNGVDIKRGFLSLLARCALLNTQTPSKLIPPDAQDPQLGPVTLDELLGT